MTTQVVRRGGQATLLLAQTALLLTLVACGPQAASSDRVVLRGAASAGPTCAVEKQPPEPQCAERPVAGAVILVREPDGAAVGQVTTARTGAFTISLRPGQYRLVAQPVDGLMGTPRPLTVNLVSGKRPKAVVLHYDTGIR